MTGGDNAGIRAIVFGRVQGVGFRDHVYPHARALGLVGYVRNLDDGTVEVVAEGPHEVLERLIAHLHAGPGRVDGVDVEWLPPVGEFTDFRPAW